MRLIVRLSFVTIALFLMFIGPVQPASAQGRGGATAQGPLSMIYGDVRVQADKDARPLPGAFQLALYDIRRYLVARQTVAPGGRYRFMSIGNGEYDLVVEADGVEIAKFHWFIEENRSTDRRQDLTIPWRANPSDLGREGGAAAARESLYKRNNENESRYEQALDAASKKDYDKAIGLMNRLLAADPKDFEAWSKLAVMQQLRGNMAEAEKSYERSLQEKPDYLVALTKLGTLRVATKNFDGAIESLSKAVDLNPASADVNFLLGEAYLQVKKGSKAVGYLNEAIRLDPNGKAEAHLRLAALYDAARLKDKAAAEYEQFLVKRPEYPDKKKLEEYIQQNKRP